MNFADRIREQEEKKKSELLKRLNLEGEDAVEGWQKKFKKKEEAITGKEAPKPQVVGGGGSERGG